MAQKPLTTKELRALTEKERVEQLHERRRELWQYRMKAKDGSLQQPHVLRLTRRQIARVQTVMREQQQERSNAGTQQRTRAEST